MNTKDHFNQVFAGDDWKSKCYDYDSRLALITKELERYEKHLDIGCADGTFTKEYLRIFPDTHGWGIDISEKAIELANRRECKGAKFYVGDIYNMSSMGDGFFDFVHCAGVIEHLEDPAKSIAEIRRILAPDGVLLVSVPSRVPDDYNEAVWEWDFFGNRKYEPTRFKEEMLKEGWEVLADLQNFNGGNYSFLKLKKV